jgi:drug/metabolite transporter (DMT)-like permease
MLELFLVSLVWAFSFGLIKDNLSALDPSFVACVRISLAFLALLPFLRIKAVTRKQATQFTLIGVFQFGIMYIAYNYSFLYLKAFEVALFTIFTPIYVALLDDLFTRRIHMLAILTSIMAVIGTGIVILSRLESHDLLLGFLILQASNLCFAFGQVYYKKVAAAIPGFKDRQVFALLFLGGAVATAISTVLVGDRTRLAVTPLQAGILLYLGLIASGLCFFMWNHGARKVNTGTLAVFNDLKIPLSIAVSLLVFGESTDVLHLVIGGAIILVAMGLNEYAAWLGRRQAVRQPEP